MTLIRCIAIDDEPPALRQMVDYIQKVNYLELIDTFDNAMDAMTFLKDNSIDLIFLDIKMEHLSGIQMLKLLEKKPFVILTTAYDTYALDAFDLEVDDYLLKPISFERFYKSTERIYKQISGPPTVEGSISTVEDSKDYFFVKTDFKIQRVDFKDILYIEGLKEYLIIKTEEGNIYTLNSFKSILEKLPENEFIRVHKSYIVPLSKIDTIKKTKIYIGEKYIPIGATYRDAFFSKIK